MPACPTKLTHSSGRQPRRSRSSPSPSTSCKTRSATRFKKASLCRRRPHTWEQIINKLLTRMLLRNTRKYCATRFSRAQTTLPNKATKPTASLPQPATTTIAISERENTKIRQYYKTNINIGFFTSFINNSNNFQ